MPFFKKKKDKQAKEMKIRRTITILKARKRNFENKAEELRRKAKDALIHGQKDKARSLLLRSKYYIRQAKKYDGMLSNLEAISTHIEIGEDLKVQTDTLKEAESLLRETAAEVSPEKIGATMSDISDHMSTIEMAGDISAESIDSGIDELSVDDELERLSMEVALEKEFPEIPKKETSKESDEEVLDELELLRREIEKEKEKS